MEDFITDLLVDIDAYVREMVDKYGYKKVKEIGLGGMAKGFYLGIEPEPGIDPYEFFEAMPDITTEEYDLWEGLFYKKNSWLNREV